MMSDIHHGSPSFPPATGSIASSTQDEMESAVRMLRDHKDIWATLPVHERITIINRLIKNFAALSPRWAAASCKAKGITEDAPLVAEEWGAGTLPIIHTLRKLRQSLSDIESYGNPRIPGPVTTRPNGQVVAHVFPEEPYERLFFLGMTAEVWMEPSVTAADLSRTQAIVYQVKQPSGKVALVLGAGNVASIGPADTLLQAFCREPSRALQSKSGKCLSGSSVAGRLSRSGGRRLSPHCLWRPRRGKLSL